MFMHTLIRSLVESVLPTAAAHCDTADGPAVTDGRRALETGNVNFALKWIQTVKTFMIWLLMHGPIALNHYCCPHRSLPLNRSNELSQFPTFNC